MRVALVGLIFFALAATARADTWVPDDPADPEALAPPATAPSRASSTT